MTTGVLLLAAGRGRRFGADKRFARLPGGEYLLEACLRVIAESGLPLRVCLRPGDRRAQALLRSAGVEALVCPDADRGMGHSLARGFRGVSDWDAALVALADMPWIGADSYRAVAGAAEAGRIVVPTYRGQRGHPVAFGAGFFPELTALADGAGDRGARELLTRHAAQVGELPLDDPGILRDVDRPADLQA